MSFVERASSLVLSWERRGWILYDSDIQSVSFLYSHTFGGVGTELRLWLSEHGIETLDATVNFMDGALLASLKLPGVELGCEAHRRVEVIGLAVPNYFPACLSEYEGRARYYPRGDMSECVLFGPCGRSYAGATVREDEQ